MKANGNFNAPNHLKKRHDITPPPPSKGGILPSNTHSFSFSLLLFTMPSILETLAPELLFHILSFMSLVEVYRIRSVSKEWQHIAEEHIYSRIRSQHCAVQLRIGKSDQLTVNLLPHSYDAKDRVIEFRPTSGTIMLPTEHSASLRRLQIRFCEWPRQWNPPESPLSSKRNKDRLDDISLEERAAILFHMHYNPALERVYELPPWSKPPEEHYVGDKSLILALSYIPSSSSSHEETYGYPNSTTAVPILHHPPCIQVRWLRVTLAWILSGMNSEIAPTQIYPERYARLDQALARHGFFKYDPLSEPVLSHIVDLDSDKFPTADDDVPHALLDYVQTHTHECHTRLSRLQHMLEGAGVDADVLWKYTFAKSYVVGNGSLLGEEDVVRRIQDSEEEWRVRRQSIMRRFGSA